MKSQVGYIKGS